MILISLQPWLQILGQWLGDKNTETVLVQRLSEGSQNKPLQSLFVPTLSLSICTSLCTDTEAVQINADRDFVRKMSITAGNCQCWSLGKRQIIDSLSTQPLLSVQGDMNRKLSDINQMSTYIYIYILLENRTEILYYPISLN